MSTLINLALALAASLLSLTGVHRSAESAPQAQVEQCKEIHMNTSTNCLIKNEQLSQLIK